MNSTWLHIRTKQKKGLAVVIIWSALVFVLSLGVFVPETQAVAVLIQSKTASVNGKTLSATFSSTPVAGRLLIAVCGAYNSSSASTTPAGFTVARAEAGNPAQSIFYKVSTGDEASVTCTAQSTTQMGIHIYEYAGTLATAPFDKVNPTSSSGTTGPANSGSLATAYVPELLFAAVTARGNSTFTAWSSGFTEQNDFKSGTTVYFGAAHNTVTTSGTYSTAATLGANGWWRWRGQHAAFKLMPIQLVADIVDGTGASVSSPSVTFANQTFGFTCQTAVGTLGTTTQKLRISNTTAAPGWALSIAPTAGVTATWADASTNKYDFNDPTTAGCGDGADADTLGGQMTINPSAGTVTAVTNGCNNTGVTLGTSTAFSQGVKDSITLVNGGSTAGINCTWDVTGITISQTIPAEQYYASYSLGLTLTLVAQ
ncbi:hypothetical protein KBC77_03775 [Candidatus Saccharibacteria bacterium]|nr:hypothetical protein [Candidatus Saccharibacteria bacterium]